MLSPNPTRSAGAAVGDAHISSAKTTLRPLRNLYGLFSLPALVDGIDYDSQWSGSVGCEVLLEGGVSPGKQTCTDCIGPRCQLRPLISQLRINSPTDLRARNVSMTLRHYLS
jgi:hypothetical protein